MPNAVPFITRVRIANYKSIRACDISLGPLTFLIGTNGAGKTNFLDALAFVSQALATTPAQAIHDRNGFDSIVHRFPQPASQFSITLDAQVPTGLEGTKQAVARYGFEISRSNEPGERDFRVTREICRVRWPDDDRMIKESPESIFSVYDGQVEQYSSLPIGERTVEPDRLFLPLAAAQPSFAPLFVRLRDMFFYSFELRSLRATDRESAGPLGPYGEHLGDILVRLRRDHPEVLDRFNEYMKAIVPSYHSMYRRLDQMLTTVELHTQETFATDQSGFGPQDISDGTLRAAGVLAALFQPDVLDARTSLIGMEDPEIALHPSATGALFDAMKEASRWVQIVATTHSGDLLDRDDIDVSSIRSALYENGETAIGEIDEASKQSLHDRLFTPGELLRADQLTPDADARQTAQVSNFDAFGD
ncbi:MAG: AAA family ATPase [Actinomycetota bacterium]|nr:AAA family ATPase [Actinomycetota bacterium]